MPRHIKKGDMVVVIAGNLRATYPNNPERRTGRVLRVITDEDLNFRPAERVGELILDRCDSDGYDHVIMGQLSGDDITEEAIMALATRKEAARAA